jgi:hypothetical protein
MPLVRMQVAAEGGDLFHDGARYAAGEVFEAAPEIAARLEELGVASRLPPEAQPVDPGAGVQADPAEEPEGERRSRRSRG